ncbi:hypothetical protein Poli38472_004547 [Pythium oligandrum]|uniref:tRNA N(3)-methylcytidine methyltransferase n=1 Tax=Pythium oligandrum TaxID=41045 RepID=A0A8K1CAM5_PYTOL|nr:hypothetical protein Poli38472_004547 [Pythium oligandrum]|eukprot:TMW59478.1 hypothetical protein Poli38472_004547 [Pythium oligandrum]
MTTKKSVELHSHDFEWEELARECQKEAEDTEDDAGEETEEMELSTIAKERWELFHQRNHGKAYKPRNYLVKEFPELHDPANEQVRVLEVGCGYGSAIFPILDECPNVFADVCDFSAHAIDILHQNPQYNPQRCHAFVCDITQDDLGLPAESVDVVLMVFVLSAVPPTAFSEVLRKVSRVLKPGGVLCFRDYGLYDLAMRRNAKRLAPSLYYRSDGTLAYFFSREDIERLCGEELGLQVVENEYCTVRLVNRKKQVTMDRVWLHAKCRKPTS